MKLKTMGGKKGSMKPTSKEKWVKEWQKMLVMAGDKQELDIVKDLTEQLIAKITKISVAVKNYEN